LPQVRKWLGNGKREKKIKGQRKAKSENFNFESGKIKLLKKSETKLKEINNADFNTIEEGMKDLGSP